MRTSTPLSALVAATLLAACGAKDAAPPGGGTRPPPEVAVVQAHLQAVSLQTELPGRVEPLRVAQVRARVNGVVHKRVFQEGSVVKAGELLFEIDPAPYQAALNSAQAALGKAQANHSQASALAERYKPLAAAHAVSQQEYLNAVAASLQAQADVAAAKAALQIAQLNAGYANVSAPIGGRIGRALVSEGQLVNATEATQLALIQQTDSVYINLTQPAQQLQRLRGNKGADAAVPVTVLLDDGTELARKGKLLFSDITVDPATGQVSLRAEIANPDGALLPGQFVRVRLAQSQLPAAVLLPQQAVNRSGQGDSVLVVGADAKPVQRPVKVGPAQGTDWIILDGLKEGEQVVVEGFQKMMVQGAPVKPVPWKAAPAAAAAPASAASAPAR